MRHRIPRVAILLSCVALLATAGCLPGLPELPDLPDLPGLPEAEEPELEPPLKDTSWVLEAYGEQGTLTPALASTDVTLEFGAGGLNGNAGCNSYFGSYTSETDGSLEVSDLANTEMACMEPGVMEQEGEYLATLREAGTYVVVGGKLRIIGGGKVLLLGQSEEAPSEEAPSPVEQPLLKNTSWVLDAYGRPGRLRPAIAGREPTMDFSTSELNGSAGCNSYFGSYTSDTDGSLEISDIGSTAMYCMEEDVRDQEQAFLDALAGADKYEVVGGKLRITGAGKVLLLGQSEEAPSEEAPSPVEQPLLKNTSWVLDAYGTPGSLTPAIAGREPTMDFSTSELNGSAGCNSYFGSYTSDTDGSLEIGDIGSTAMYCMEEDVRDQEQAFLDAFAGADKYEVVAGKLRITGAGKVLLLGQGEEAPSPVEQPLLKNTSWVLDAYGRPGRLRPAIAGREPTMDFSTTELNGSAGCNSYFGSYTSDTDGSLEMSDIGSTAMYCMEEDVRDQEQAFLDALSGADTYEVVEGKLRITGAGKMLVLSHN